MCIFGVFATAIAIANASALALLGSSQTLPLSSSSLSSSSSLVDAAVIVQYSNSHRRFVAVFPHTHTLEHIYYSAHINGSLSFLLMFLRHSYFSFRFFKYIFI